MDGTSQFKKLLIVEDDADIKDQLVEAFSEQGYVVEYASDANSALVKIKNTKFDCILMDYQIPGQNGLQLTAYIKSSKVNARTPVFIISGNLNERAKEMALKLKVYDVITKPFEADQIVKTVNERLNEKPLTYDSKIISIFLESASEIFEFYFKEKPIIGKPGAKKQGAPARGAITGLIGFSSPGYVGSLALSVNVAYIKGLAKAIFPESEVTLDKEVAADIVGEMCNQVLGVVKRKFSILGHQIRLGLPEVVMGKDHTIVHKVKNPVLFIPLGKNKMGCDVEFCLDKVEIEVMEEEQAEELHDGGTVLLF